MLYVIEVFDGSRRIVFSNRDAGHTSASTEGSTLAIRNRDHRQLPISVTAKVHFDDATGLSSWNIEVDNQSTWGILSVEYPCILTPNSLGDIADDRILAKGMLTNFPDPVQGYWNWGESYWSLAHPQSTLQFMAFYDANCGLYFSSQDTEGYAKRNNILRIVDQMKFSHTYYPEYSRGGSYRSPYSIVITTFEGRPTTWQDAADLYRQWAVRQWWCKRKWFEREDVPRWLKHGAGVIVPRNYMNYAKEGESYYRNLWVEGQRYSEAVGRESLLVLFHGWGEGKTKATQLGHPQPVPHEPFQGAELFREACAKTRANRCLPFVFIAAPHLYVHTFGGGDYDNKDLYLREARQYEIMPPAVFLKQAEPPKEIPTIVHMCPGTEYWRQCVRKECLQLVDLGRYVLLHVGSSTVQVIDLAQPARIRLVLEEKRMGMLYGDQITDGLVQQRFASAFWHTSGYWWIDLGGVPQSTGVTFARRFSAEDGAAGRVLMLLGVLGVLLLEAAEQLGPVVGKPGAHGSENEATCDRQLQRHRA